MANFVCDFLLKPTPYQLTILETRFEIGRKMYNALVNISLKRLKELEKTKAYRELISSLTNDPKKNIPIWNQINAMRREYKLSEYAFHDDIKPMQHHFKKHIDSSTAQKIATTVWKAYQKYFFGNGKTIHFKKYGTLLSLESKQNTTGIRFRNNTITWNKLMLPLASTKFNKHEQEILLNRICYCRIIRKPYKNTFRYYAQPVFDGVPPQKHIMGQGKIGLDIGPSTIAIVGNDITKLLPLADRVLNLEKEKRVIQRKMDRSRRATNPDNFNSDGTIKDQGSKKVIWHRSHRYLKNQDTLRNLFRKQAAIRKQQHEELSNVIIALGNEIYVESMNFAGLAKRAKKTEKNDKGQYKKKKRLGKSIGNRAPAMLLTMINRKLSYHDRQLIKINTSKARASQYNHFSNGHIKKPLSQRWNQIGRHEAQRDLYSAFLISNVNSDLASFDRIQCFKQFPNFMLLHNAEINRLRNQQNPRCMGIHPNKQVIK